MKLNFNIFLSALSFYVPAKTIYQIHSPSVYKLLEHYLLDKPKHQDLDRILALRRGLRHSNAKLFRKGYGAISKEEEDSLEYLESSISCSHRRGKRICSLMQNLKPDRILELGTGIGISTLYIATASRDSLLISIEGEHARIKQAAKLISMFDLRNVELIRGKFEAVLSKLGTFGDKINFVHIDEDHRKSELLKNIKLIQPFLDDKAILLIDDIRWSKDMEEAWKELNELECFDVSIDLFTHGFLRFSPANGERLAYKILPTRYKPWKMLFNLF